MFSFRASGWLSVVLAVSAVCGAEPKKVTFDDIEIGILSEAESSNTSAPAPDLQGLPDLAEFPELSELNAPNLDEILDPPAPKESKQRSVEPKSTEEPPLELPPILTEEDESAEMETPDFPENFLKIEPPLLEPKTESKPESKPEPKPEPQPEPKQEPQPVAQEEPAPEPEPMSPASPAPPVVETASFNGIVPGKTTLEELKKILGPPEKETPSTNGQQTLTFQMENFQSVTVFLNDSLVLGLNVALQSPVDARQLAESLGIAHLQSVFLTHPESGRILGEIFPEIGVTLDYNPTDPSVTLQEAAEPGRSFPTNVVNVAFQPISPDPFVLRATVWMESDPARSLQDLNEALRLQPDHVEAIALKKQVEERVPSVAKKEAEPWVELDSQTPAAPSPSEETPRTVSSPKEETTPETIAAQQFQEACQQMRKTLEGTPGEKISSELDALIRKAYRLMGFLTTQAEYHATCRKTVMFLDEGIPQCVRLGQVAQAKKHAERGLKMMDYVLRSGGNQDLQNHYWMGRMYFRMGQVQGLDVRHPDAARTPEERSTLEKEIPSRKIFWYEKAVPYFVRMIQSPIAKPASQWLELGKMLNEMSAAYWERGDAKRTLLLLKTGGACLEQYAAQDSSAEMLSARRAICRNIINVCERLNDTQQAERFRKKLHALDRSQ